ncbi:MAG: hypothetical protein ACRDQ2_17095, partial [Gaiellales bacterium]
MVAFAEWTAFAIGLALVVTTGAGMIRALVVPRGEASHLAAFVSHEIVWRSFLRIVNPIGDYERKDRVLALAAPIAVLATLLMWFLLFLFGYTLMLVPFTGGSLGHAVEEAGSSMLTLGIFKSTSSAATAIDFAAAASGLIVIALQIGYLPTLYGSFNRRETLVTLLQSRAGAPAWGPEILARSAQAELQAELPDFYAEWERWAADVAESHSTYPVLVWFRSPHALRSWIVGLLAVMDSAALYHSLCPSTSPAQARLCMRMGFTALRYIADVIRIDYDPDPYPNDPITLTYEEFLGGVHRMEEAGFEMERSPEEAWVHFRGWRVNYEQVAYAIADEVVAPPGPWSGA